MKIHRPRYIGIPLTSLSLFHLFFRTYTHVRPPGTVKMGQKRGGRKKKKQIETPRQKWLIRFSPQELLVR